MKKGDLQRRLTESPRVLAVATSAIQLLAKEHLGLPLDREVAESLALSGDMRAVMDQLEDRSGARRPGLSKKEEANLAAQEVSLRQAGESEESIRRVIEERITTALDQKRHERDAARETGRLEKMLDQYEKSSPELRHFFRRVERLWRNKTSKLQAMISEEDRLEEAIEELENVFSEHLEMAVEVVDRNSRIG